jgi:hypothetical protein
MSDDVNSFLLLLVVLKCVASYALNAEFLESQVLDNTGSMVKDDQQKNVHIKYILSHRFVVVVPPNVVTANNNPCKNVS